MSPDIDDHSGPQLHKDFVYVHMLGQESETTRSNAYSPHMWRQSQETNKELPDVSMNKHIRSTCDVLVHGINVRQASRAA